MGYLGNNNLPFDPLRSNPKLDADRFSGNGSSVAFTLTQSVNAPTDIQVFIENVPQEPIVAYSVVGTALTFTSAPPSGTNNIYVVYRNYDAAGVFVPDGSITYAKLANNIRTFTQDLFTANGTGQTFTLTENPADANTLAVTIDGVTQSAPSNYSVTGTTIIFTSAPAASSNVSVKHLGFKTVVTTLPPTTVTAGTYGNASSIPAITVGADGRITGASNVAVSIPSGSYITTSNNSILTTNTVITANTTIAPNTGGLTIGPLVLANGITLTVSANARHVIL
jgi:hypothetical protein